MSANASAKADLRLEIRASLEAISSKTWLEASAKIVSTIRPPSGSNCALFAGTSKEPQLLSLLANSQCRWHLPRVARPGLMSFHRVTDHCNLTKSSFGILEPDCSAPEISASQLDLILCPGLAFSTSGKRLGQGGGFYDRYLPKTTKARFVGIALDFLIRDSIPCDPHDIAMHEIISESRHLTISSPEPPS